MKRLRKCALLLAGFGAFGSCATTPAITPEARVATWAAACSAGHAPDCYFYAQEQRTSPALAMQYYEQACRMGERQGCAELFGLRFKADEETRRHFITILCDQRWAPACVDLAIKAHESAADAAKLAPEAELWSYCRLAATVTADTPLEGLVAAQEACHYLANHAAARRREDMAAKMILLSGYLEAEITDRAYIEGQRQAVRAVAFAGGRP